MLTNGYFLQAMRESRLGIRTERGCGSAEPNELDLVMSRDRGVKADPHLSPLAKNPPGMAR